VPTVLCAQGTYCIAQAKGYDLDLLRLDGSWDDQAGEAGPFYRRPRVSKLFKRGYQACVNGKWFL
jgi:hypothetical protein